MTDPHAKTSYTKGSIQSLTDLVAFPLRCLISDDANERIGLTSLRHERCAFTARHCEGHVLDVGCGTNKLAAIRRHVVGVDVFPWPEIDALVDTTRLPFGDESFDTVTLIACLNHIPRRGEVLGECRRLLKPGGLILVTMISPLIGNVSHRLNRWDPDQRERGMTPDELYGMWNSQVVQLLSDSGFRQVRRRRFLYGLNNLFLARK